MKQIRSAIIVNTLNNFDVLVTTIETNLTDITRHTYKSWLTSYPHITETLTLLNELSRVPVPVRIRIL